MGVIISSKLRKTSGAAPSQGGIIDRRGLLLDELFGFGAVATLRSLPLAPFLALAARRTTIAPARPCALRAPRFRLRLARRLVTRSLGFGIAMPRSDPFGAFGAALRLGHISKKQERTEKKHLGEPVWPRLAGQGGILVEKNK